MTNVKFCVLSYYPSILNEENINVGLLFLNVDTKERSFYILRNTKRLASFDDEIDMDFMMACADPDAVPVAVAAGTASGSWPSWRVRRER